MQRSHARVREYNIEEVMERKRGMSCRGQKTGEDEELGGHMEGRGKRRRVKANVVSAV